MKPICLYHFPCADGFTAAWVVYKRFGDQFEYMPAKHGSPPPDMSDREVLMVDFSYDFNTMEQLAKEANQILVLDHHKSAEKELDPFTPARSVDDHTDIRLEVSNGHMTFDSSGKVMALFDMERSGAGMAWDFFFPITKRPRFVDHIEDRDLLRFDLPGTREIQAAVFSYPYDFKAWDWMARDIALASLISEGSAIERKHNKDVEELVSQLARPIQIAGYNVLVASIPYTMTSDAGNLMCEMPVDNYGPGPFAACYWDEMDKRVFSLRSDGDFDVSEVARSMGGGGHHNAAGFQVPRDHELARI